MEHLHPSEKPARAVPMGVQYVPDEMPILAGERQQHRVLLGFQLVDTGRVVVMQLDIGEAATLAFQIYATLHEEQVQ